jgi:hypothetical protein
MLSHITSAVSEGLGMEVKFSFKSHGNKYVTVSFQLCYFGFLLQECDTHTEMYLTSEILMMKMLSMVLYVVIPCGLVDDFQHYITLLS